MIRNCPVCLEPFKGPVPQMYCSWACCQDDRLERVTTRVPAGRLKNGAAPTELHIPLTPAGVDEHRRIHCRQYDGCVDYATAKVWRSFSCRTCPVRNEWSNEELREQALKVAASFRESYEE